MSCPIDPASLDRLKIFLNACKAQPDILYLPQLSFFKEFIESLGGKLPKPQKMSSEPQFEPKMESQETKETAASDSESELELDMTGCIDPDKLSDEQQMGDSTKEVTEEDSDKADEKRQEAMAEFSQGNLDKALELLTAAIELNPHSALLFAKRGQVYLKLNKPNACIKDCTKALELNPDSAASYKFRGRSYRLIGEWELAAKDLRQACNIDFDEQTDEWLKEVTPNAKKIEEHIFKQERKKKEKEEQERLDRIRKAREAHARAASAEKSEYDIPTPEGSAGGMPGMGDFYKLLQDPEIMTAFQDPEVSAAFQDISSNPANFSKYQSNTKIMDLLSKLSSKFPGSESSFPGFPGGAGGFPGFTGAGFGGAGAGFGGAGAGFGGAGAGNPEPPKPDDDNLD